MADFARIQNRIYYGYGKASLRLGTTHSVYRSSTGINPIASGNLLGTQLFSMDADLKYIKPRKYGDNTWQFLPQDAQGTTLFALQNYDYLVGSTVTYFIVDILPDDRLSPPLCMQCNGIVSIFSPSSTTLTPGSGAYIEYQLGQGVTRVTACPASILQYSTGNKEVSLKLPTSPKLPYYQIVLPEFGGTIIKTGDMITDDAGRTMIIVSAERTTKNLGFRIVASEVAT